jgi:hypothetical protein
MWEAVVIGETAVFVCTKQTLTQVVPDITDRELMELDEEFVGVAMRRATDVVAA